MKSLILIPLIFACPIIVTGENLFQPEPYIIGGTNATKGEFPFLISLWADNHFVCGGTLVDKSVVVTAAHCVTNSGQPIAAKRFKVKAGDHIRTIVDPEEQTRTVKINAVHPNFFLNRTHVYNDVALLFTESPFVLNDAVKVAPLNNAFTQTNVGTVVGWGVFVEDGSRRSSLYPQKVQLNIANNGTCSQKFGMNGFHPAVQFCAGGESKGACFGDSGGPFLVGSDKTFHGIVSYGRDRCVTDNIGGVFQRVAPYVDWIQETIKNSPDTFGSDTGGVFSSTLASNFQSILIFSCQLLPVLISFMTYT